MSMHMWWVIKSIIVGLIVMLLICFMFSIAFSISARENKMISNLEQYKDYSFDYSLGSGDIFLLAAIGSIIALFAGGMTATLLAHPDKASSYKWILPWAIVAFTTILVVDGYILITWNDNVQKWHQSSIDEFGRPFEPMDPFTLIFLMLVTGGACFVASAAGGAVAWISRDVQASCL